jgi:hypothetical protein
MGNFYVKSSDQHQVADGGSARRISIITPPQNGYVVVYDEEADHQAEGPITVLAASPRGIGAGNTNGGDL